MYVNVYAHPFACILFNINYFLFPLFLYIIIAAKMSKPKALVKPQIKEKSDVFSSGDVYENISMIQYEPQPIKSVVQDKADQGQGHANSAVTAKQPPKAIKGKLPKTNAQESRPIALSEIKQRDLSWTSSEENGELTPAEQQSFEFDGDVCPVAGVMDTIYTNAATLSDSEPANIPLNMLQKCILEKLKGGKLEDEFLVRFK